MSCHGRSICAHVYNTPTCHPNEEEKTMKKLLAALLALSALAKETGKDE